MKFSCEKAILQAMVSIASRTVAPKSAIPALEGLLLEAGKELCLTGYNLKTGIRTVVPADITEEGSLVLSARLFGDIIRRLPDDVVTVATQDYMVNITCGMSEFNILGTDAGEFPELPIVEYQNSLILPQRVLHSMIDLRRHRRPHQGHPYRPGERLLRVQHPADHRGLRHRQARASRSRPRSTRRRHGHVLIPLS